MGGRLGREAPGKAVGGGREPPGSKGTGPARKRVVVEVEAVEMEAVEMVVEAEEAVVEAGEAVMARPAPARRRSSRARFSPSSERLATTRSGAISAPTCLGRSRSMRAWSGVWARTMEK